MDPRSIERLIERGRDDYTARLAAGQARLTRGDLQLAIKHLLRAVEHDPEQSIAWQWLGKARLQGDDSEGAADAWRRGIEAAERRGDKQAEKVMRVWLRRLQRSN
ncbi:MAG: tetratricopeptide repeat protein [Gammaproteobacteria bacterium]|nr:tetratricopeptide repeat protein [Gammaproteobacteria bacterium]